MIMSGRTVWHLPRRGIRGENAESRTAPQDLAETQTLAAVFNRAGYDTMRTCKRGNSYKAANAQFTVVHDKTCRKRRGSRRTARLGTLSGFSTTLADRESGRKR